MGQFSGLTRVKNILIPVDEIGVNKLISGTKGDLIGTNGTVKSELAVGADNLFLQAASGELTGLQWAAAGGMWTELETLTPTSGTSISTGTLTAYDEYLIVVDAIEQSGAGTFELRVDSDAGANYNFREIDSAGVSNTTGASAFMLTNAGDGAHPLYGEIRVQGKASTGQGRQKATALFAGGTDTASVMHHGLWDSGIAGHQLDTFTFIISTGAYEVGNIVIFGRTVA